MDGRQAEKEESKGDAQIIYFPRAHVETWVYERVWQGQSCPWKPCLDIATQVGTAGSSWAQAGPCSLSAEPFNLGALVSFLLLDLLHYSTLTMTSKFPLWELC